MANILKFIFIVIAVSANAQTYKTPTQKVSWAQMDNFIDDLDFLNLDLAIDRQLESFKKKPKTVKLMVGKDVYSVDELINSLQNFKKLTESYKNCMEFVLKENCLSNFQNEIKTKFNLYAPHVAKNVPATLFTAYYSPMLEGSLTPSREFSYAIYAKPDSANRGLYSRVEIDLDKKLKGQGLELFYIKDLFDLYLLHIEGGGVIQIKSPTGEIKNFSLAYDATNGKSFKFISRYMLDQGYIDSPSVFEQRAFLNTYPEKWREIYSYSPSYVFFKQVTTPPLGVDNIPLTDFRSMALDRTLYSFKGLLGFVKTKKPQLDDQGRLRYQDFGRFFLDQDTGGAIKGAARADLYFGIGKDGELAANFLKANGELFFLVQKK